MFFSSMSDLLYGTMNLIVPIAVKYFETFCISQKSKSIEIIIVRNSVIMFDLSVKKKIGEFIKMQCTMFIMSV